MAANSAAQVTLCPVCQAQEALWGARLFPALPCCPGEVQTPSKQGRGLRSLTYRSRCYQSRWVTCMPEIDRDVHRPGRKSRQAAYGPDPIPLRTHTASCHILQPSSWAQSEGELGDVFLAVFLHHLSTGSLTIIHERGVGRGRNKHRKIEGVLGMPSTSGSMCPSLHLVWSPMSPWLAQVPPVLTVALLLSSGTQ